MPQVYFPYTGKIDLSRGSFSPLFADLDRSRSIARSSALNVASGLAKGLRSSINGIAN